MTDVRVEGGAELIAPEPLDEYRGTTGWEPVRPDVPGVPLTRLVALAALSPSQVLEVGAGLLAALAERPDVDPGSVAADCVRVDRNGWVVLDPGTGLGAQRTVAAVLGELTSAARQRVPAADDLLTELDRVVAAGPVTGVRAAAQALERVCATIDRPAVRAELAALVRALLTSAGGATGAAPSRATGQRHQAVPPSARTRATGRRVWAWLLSIAVLVAVVALEVALLRDDILRDVDLLLEAGRSGSAAPSGATEPDGLPVQPPAPPSAGPVAGVDLRPLETCTPGAPCEVRVLVRLAPAPDPQTVAWSFRVVDRCTGATDTAPGGTLTVPGGATEAAAIGTVALPERQAVALVAVTDLPAAAAAPPLFAGACGTGGSSG